MTEFKPLKEIIKEEMRSQGLNAQKLSELTGIAPRYINAFMGNDLSDLPPAPYVRGYIESIAKILGIDPEPLWQDYQNETEIKRSGENDRLPTNRYAQKPFNKMALVITIIVLVILALLIPRIADFLGQPSIELTSPPSDKFTSTQDTYTLKGRIGNPQDKLVIGDEEVVVSKDGTFEKQVALKPGCNDNVYDFTVKRFLGLSTTIRRTICYETNNPLNVTSTSTPAPNSTSTQIINN
jgi:transcriptional regulator with XRE-family HTH domain